MPLHHWPNPRVPWRSLRNFWVVQIAEYLNREQLPPGFQARPTELVVGIEPDGLLLQEHDRPEDRHSAEPRPALAEATLTAVLPSPAEWPMVGVYSAYDTSRLVAAIELVSPRNKDRPETVRAFVSKALFLLHEGVHLMVVDVISLPRQPIRRVLLQALEIPGAMNEERLWVSSYYALPGEDPQPHTTIREWARDLAVGDPLPTLPLFLRADELWVEVDLEATYQATLEGGRYRPA
ncbi:MAG: DUF4058 family protein [Chloroflexi bacterium]|nr:DUF4058 family protein [Chloroflexota bacterium]